MDNVSKKANLIIAVLNENLLIKKIIEKDILIIRKYIKSRNVFKF